MSFKYGCLFVGLLMFSFTGTAQDALAPARVSHYVFDTFSKGKVHQKTGVNTDELLNYNALTGEMVFDAKGNYLAIAHPENVDTVYILDRIFIPVGNKFYELILRSSNPLFLDFSCTLKEPDTNIGYGTTSKTSSGAPIKTLVQTGGVYKLKLPDEYEVKAEKNYLLFKDGKYLRANNAQQLSKIYPEKKAMINDLSKKNHIDFSKQEELVRLIKEIQQ